MVSVAERPGLYRFVADAKRRLEEYLGKPRDATQRITDEQLNRVVNGAPKKTVHIGASPYVDHPERTYVGPERHNMGVERASVADLTKYVTPTDVIKVRKGTDQVIANVVKIDARILDDPNLPYDAMQELERILREGHYRKESGVRAVPDSGKSGVEFREDGTYSLKMDSRVAEFSDIREPEPRYDAKLTATDKDVSMALYGLSPRAFERVYTGILKRNPKMTVEEAYSAVRELTEGRNKRLKAREDVWRKRKTEEKIFPKGTRVRVKIGDKKVYGEIADVKNGDTPVYSIRTEKGDVFSAAAKYVTKESSRRRAVNEEIKKRIRFYVDELHGITLADAEKIFERERKEARDQRMESIGRRKLVAKMADELKTYSSRRLDEMAGDYKKIMPSFFADKNPEYAQNYLRDSKLASRVGQVYEEAERKLGTESDGLKAIQDEIVDLFREAEQLGEPKSQEEFGILADLVYETYLKRHGLEFIMGKAQK